LRYPKPFNYSAINNFAVEQAHGELVCLMNNDMEVISPDWLEEMASHALRPGIGAVGAILYYPDDTIQHAGVVLGLGGVAGHLFSRMPRGTDGYFNRARVVQNFTAVTAACLVVQRAAYREVGGLNETLKVAFNDVDFCLKLHASGRRNLWTPHAEFYHHESASRGAEDTTEKHRRFVSEVEYMQEHWHHLIADDPAYNLNLGTEDGECRLASPPRVPLLRTHAVPERELDETSVLA
jgi:GT2 family glycosyltransferase